MHTRLTPIAQVAFFSTALLAAMTDAAHKTALSQAAWHAMCDVAAAFEERMKLAEASYTNAQRRAKRASLQALQAEVYGAAAISDSDKQVMIPLVAFLKAQAYAYHKAADDSKTIDLIDATRRGALVQGRLKEFLNIAATKDASNNGCVHKADAQNSLVESLNELAADYAACKALTTRKDVPKTAAATLLEDGIKVFKEPAAAATREANEQGCRLLTRENTHSYIEGDQSGTAKDLAAGLIKIRNGKAQHNQHRPGQHNAAADELYDVDMAFQAFRRQPADISSELPWPDKIKLQADPTFNVAFKATFGTSQEANEQLFKQLFARFYGGSDQGDEPRVYTSMRAYKTPVELGGSLGGVNITATDDEIKLTELLSYFQAAAFNRSLKNKAAASAENKLPSGLSNRDCAAAGDEQAKCKELAGKGCTYDASKPPGQKCTLSEEGKQKAAANQETGAETVKCSDYDTKDKCEAVNTAGKPATCGWRSGKDNEDEKDKVKCRDSSFLVNKKFALTLISAAFVALLF